MPISIEPFDEAILLVTFAGQCSVADVNRTFSDTIFPYCNKPSSKMVQIIYDITTLEWSFSEFVEYLETTREDNEQGLVPTNMQQYFVGNSRWGENLRQWLNANYNRSMLTFLDLDAALEYVRHIEHG